MKTRWNHRIGTLILALLTLLAAGCSAVQAQPGRQPTPSPAAYTPQTQDFVVTVAPLLVHEQQGTFPFLQQDFAQGGVLDGKEVYNFYPSTLVVYQGDTVHVTLVNPTDDEHTFTLSDLNVNVDMKAQSSTDTSFVANKVGAFTFYCAVPEHMPYQRGQLVVLPASAAPSGS